MTAPESVVRAVAKEVGRGPSYTAGDVLAATDAAFAASLEWAADQFDDAPLAYSVRGDLAPRILRRWARGER